MLVENTSVHPSPLLRASATPAQFRRFQILGPRCDLEQSLWAHAPLVPLGMDGALISLEV
jgi:hypothetical protein